MPTPYKSQARWLALFSPEEKMRIPPLIRFRKNRESISSAIIELSKPVSTKRFSRVYAMKWATRIKVFGVSWYWFRQPAGCPFYLTITGKET